jgi:hypothetical protein
VAAHPDSATPAQSDIARKTLFFTVYPSRCSFLTMNLKTLTLSHNTGLQPFNGGFQAAA